MGKLARIPRLYWAAALLCLGFALAKSGLLFYLWVFPLDEKGLGSWFLLAAADVALVRAPFAWSPRARLLTWMAGLLWFSARQEAPWLGLVLVTLPAALWLSARSASRKRWIWAGLGALLLLFGHYSEVIHPGFSQRMEELRLSIHLIALFALFRAVSWSMEVFGRGERPPFLATMEYFLAPAFLLSPLHTNSLVWSRMSGRAEPDDTLAPIVWIARGLVTAVAFTLVYRFASDWLAAAFRGGIQGWSWWHFPLAGALVFVFSYLEKSRVSYLSAGFLRLAGHKVEPDFRAPWLARDLLDYWRRFHYWVLEFYSDNLYTPFSVWLSRRLRPAAAVAAAIFLTFFLGTAFSHYVWYPGTFALCLLLGFLFGLATVMHYLLRGLLRRAWIGIPATWLTVMTLYLLAYPVFGLGWGLARLREFFGL